MHQGRIEQIFERDGATPEQLVAAASGCVLAPEEC